MEALVERSGYLLDTNTVSEWVKPHPDPGLIEWLRDADEDRTFLSVITLGEVRYGIDRMAEGRRKTRLSGWVSDEIIDRFRHRVLPVDLAVAQGWGRMRARAGGVGKCVSMLDALIAATAETHGLTVVTRNRKDFAATGVPMICPWSE